MKEEHGESQERYPKLQGDTLQDAISELCDRKQSLLLATPYFTFESRFIERVGQDLRVRATMGRRVVQHALKNQELRMRFPWGLTYYGGATRILEYEEGEAGRFLRISLPSALAPDDLRKAFRVDQVGRSTGALGSHEMDLVKVNIENISTLGLGVFCTEALPASGFQLGRKVDIALSLERGPRLKAEGRICHNTGRSLGLQFSPPLEGQQLAALAQWLEPRLEEAQRRWEDRASIRAFAERATQPKAPPSGILLVTSDAEFQENVLRAMDVHPVRTAPLALTPYKAAMEQQPPHLLILSATRSMEENRRLRLILDSVPRLCPLVVVGNPEELKTFRSSGADLRNTLFLDRNTLNSVFFQRMVLGLVRKHWNLVEPRRGT